MSYWPDTMTVKPIIDWPGQLTTARRSSPFSAGQSTTMRELDREIKELQGKNVFLQIAIPEHKFGKQGRPFADAKAEHPGVILTMDTKHGSLSYPCDTFRTWQDNLRAITLALEALRKVDRYGVTKSGEQYRGFLQLTAGATAVPTFRNVEDAISCLVIAAQVEDDGDRARLIRIAKRRTHPDNTDTGSGDEFYRVTVAERYLKAQGAL